MVPDAVRDVRDAASLAAVLHLKNNCITVSYEAVFL